MAAALMQQKRITVEEYMDFDEHSPIKNEFVNGRIVSMAGAMPEHGLININIGGELRSLLKKTHCVVYSSDIRIRVGSDDQYVYPDLSIACGKQLFETTRKPYTLLNPIMVVEVLSPSTQKYDLSEKAQLYREKESMQEILFVSPNELYVLHYSRRSDTHWIEKIYVSQSDSVVFPSLGCELPLEEIYLNVVFGEEEE